MKHKAGKLPSQRQLRVGERLRHLLVQVMRDATLSDPDLHAPHMITVTEVSVSPDLKNATAYITPMDDRDMRKTLAALNRAASYFRREIGHDLELRYTPKFTFKQDTSFEEGAHIDALLNDATVRRDVEKKDDT